MSYYPAVYEGPDTEYHIGAEPQDRANPTCGSRPSRAPPNWRWSRTT